MLVRSSLVFALPVLLVHLCACSSAESPADVCERGALVPVACESGHTPTVLATSEQPTPSNRVPKSPGSLHLALDETDIYFSTLDGAVMRVPKSGGSPESFASPPASAEPERTCLVSALTISADFVYWSVNCELEECEAGATLECATHAFVNRAPKASGGAPEIVFEQAVGRIDSLVADGSELYASVASGETSSLFEVTRNTKMHALSANFIGMIAVGPTVVYWGGRTAPRTASEIFAVPKEGIGASPLAPSVRTTGVIETFVVDDDDVYWVEEAARAGLESREVKRRSKASEEGDAIVIVGGELTPTTIAASAKGLYGIGGGSEPNAVARFTPDQWQRQRMALLGRMGNVADAKLDATTLYWVDYTQECSQRAGASGCAESRLVSRVGKLAN